MTFPLLSFAPVVAGGGYQYFILGFTACAASSRMRIGDVDYYDGSSWQPTTALTSNSGPSPLNAYASEAQNGTNVAWRAFDNNASTTQWSTSQIANASGNLSGTVYLVVDVGSANAFTPTQYRIAPYNVANYPRTWTLWGSTDGTSLTDPAAATKVELDSQTGLTSGWATATFRTFTIT